MKLSIVAYLSGDAYKKVRKLQKDMSKVTGSKASVEAWEPHITVGDGVEITGPEFVRFLGAITEAVKDVAPFTVEVQGIGSLDNRTGGDGEITTPHAIFIKVIVNPELQRLVDAVAVATHTEPHWYEMRQPYTPHVTLAFRDLDEDGYVKGLRYLIGKDTSFTADINSVSLVERLGATDTEVYRLDLKN